MHIPINLVLRGRQVVVVGGGERAARTAARLVNLGANVCVLGDAPLDALVVMERAGKITLEARLWHADDLANAIVFAASEGDAENFDVAEVGRQHGALVSVHGHPEAGDFHLPAIAEIGGGLRIAVDTEGDVPEFDRELRKYLHAAVDPGWGRGARVIGALHAALADRGEASTRGAFWDALAAELPDAGNQEFDGLKAWVERAASASGLQLGPEEIEALLLLV